MEWKEVKLGDVCSIVGDGLHGTPKYDPKGPFYFINGNNLSSGHIVIKEDTKRVSSEEYHKYKKELNSKSILVSINGTIGNVALYRGEPCILGKSACYLNVKDSIDRSFIYYVLRAPSFIKRIENEASGTTIKNVSLKQMREYTFAIPPLTTQRRIASILSSLDRKIELNNQINKQLEEMAQAIFKSWFIDFEPFKDGEFVDSELGRIPKGWRVGKAEDVYKINIGKTPPRSEREWFSDDRNDPIWVSISDMGQSGVFISDSKERLTNAAIAKHNIIMVEPNTVLLSFKLTVGRVAISNKKMTTNEAIARFILPHDFYREFTYLTLKNYEYRNLGSTSSIATAVNSKMIKSMKLLYPKEGIIKDFSIRVSPLFERIRTLQAENSHLSSLRDTLLPKLMSGEINLEQYGNQ